MAVAGSAVSKFEGSAQPIRHESLETRVAACLDAHRSLVGPAAVGDGSLAQLRVGHSADELGDAATALAWAVAEINLAMSQPGTGTRSLRARRMSDLRAEMLALVVEIQQRLLDLQQEMIRGVRTALHHLAAAETTAQLIARATVEACQSCGVDRCCLFSVDGTTLNVQSVRFTGDRAFEEEWAAFARAHPAQLHHQDREVEAMRRRIPVLVEDTHNLDGMHELISTGRASSYVATPIVVRGAVAGMIHADRYFAGKRVDPVVRDCLGVFAAGLGYALERNAWIEGTRSQLTRARAMIGDLESSMEAMLNGDSSLTGVDAQELPPVRLSPESRIATVLTTRELEVIELMARGDSNGEIATRLVISEGTVKSHVKHILRKLRATNRVQAVSAYMRIKSLSDV
jgi:DNA-binding CsgD family transcriptional regulator